MAKRIKPGPSKKLPLEQRVAELEITLGIPPAALWPNARPHWAQKARATKLLRSHAGFLAEAARREAGMVGYWPRMEVVVHIYVGRGVRRPDPDNLVAACKAAFDGLADAGLVLNDRHLRAVPGDLGRDPQRPRLVLVCRRAEEPIHAG